MVSVHGHLVPSLWAPSEAEHHGRKYVWSRAAHFVATKNQKERGSHQKQDTPFKDMLPVT